MILPWIFKLWMISDNDVFWAGLEAIATTIAAALIFFEINKYRTEQNEKNLNGFLIANDIMKNLISDEIKVMKYFLDFDFGRTKTNHGQLSIISSLLREFNVINSMLNNNLISKDLFFQTHGARLNSFANHLFEHNDKVIYLKESTDKINIPLKYIERLNYILEENLGGVALLGKAQKYRKQQKTPAVR